MQTKKNYFIGSLYLILLGVLYSCTNNSNKHVTEVSKIKQTLLTDTVATPKIGDQYRDLKMQDDEGTTVNLSGYLGHNRCVLVDCWASWCGPCLADMPALAAFYKKNHQKGFEIVGISFDQNMGQWIDAIHGFGMAWPQMSDLKGWASTAGKIYGIKALPYTILLDEHGKIIAVGLRGEELFKKITGQLK